MIMSLVKHSKRTVRRPCSRCGSKDLYWAHDTDHAIGSAVCQPCGTAGKWTLINVDGSRHACAGSSVPDESVPDVGEVDEPAPVSSVPAVSSDASTQLMEALRAAVGTPAIDRAEVERIARDVVAGLVFPTRTVVVRDNVTRTVEGTTHERLADVTTFLSAGLHVMLVGPAGTGKSTIAHQAAEALGLPSYSISLNPQLPASRLEGYMTATGEYVRTLFREAYENGGVFHFDEVDNSHPGVLATVNGALANGTMAFPDGMIKRHDDFRCVASANTYGKGATRQYVGRQAIDAATLDRFAVLTIDIDEALEDSMCVSTGLDRATVDKVLAYVRRLRRRAQVDGLPVILSPRATHGMCRAFTVGVSWDAAVDACVRRGLDASMWSKLGG